MNRLLTLIFLLIPMTVSAATVTPADCSYAAVTSAFANTFNDGDTLQIPNGTCVWTTEYLFQGKAGTITGSGSTKIITAVTGGNAAVRTKQDDDVMWTVSNFEIAASLAVQPTTGKLLDMLGASASASTTKFRITGMTFSGGLSVGDQIQTAIAGGANSQGPYNGLIDNNTFTNAALEIIQPGQDSSEWGTGDRSGTEDNWTIEDNTFTNTVRTVAGVKAIMITAGGRVVFRYNTMTNMNFDIHGMGGSQSGGGRWLEAYNNTSTINTGFAVANFVNWRGGTGVLTDNTFTVDAGGSANVYINFTEHRLTRTNQLDTHDASSTSCCTSDPCLDQIGRGKDQALSPLYVWDNTPSGADTSVIPIFSEGDGGDACGNGLTTAGYIVEDTDYYLSAKGGYTKGAYPHSLNDTTQVNNNVLGGGSLGGGSF